MKIKNLKLTNFSNYSEVNVSFDENITYLIGKNGQGKSTLGVTAIYAMFAGIAEKGNAMRGERFRFIGPKSATATGEMILHDEVAGVDIIVRRKITKNGNEVSFEAPENYPVSQQWLEDLFNVFLIAPKKFIELSSKAQAEALGIDPSKFDNELKELKNEYTLINRDITNIGSFDEVEQVDAVDIAVLSKEKDEILEFNLAQERQEYAISQAEQAVKNKEADVERIDLKIKELETQKTELTIQINAGKISIKNMPEVLEAKPVEDINEKINNASLTNQKSLAYKQFIEKKEKRQAKQSDLAANKVKQDEVINRRIAYVKEQKLPFDNLEINSDGELLLSGKPIKEPYFSTGELIRLVPILMSSKNPDLKYVFIQDFNLLDEDKQNDVEQYLTSKGMQLVIELVGTEKISNANSILLKDCKVVDSYKDTPQNVL